MTKDSHGKVAKACKRTEQLTRSSADLNSSEDLQEDVHKGMLQDGFL